MASITLEARNELIALYTAMFNAAPGASNLNDMVTKAEAGQSLLTIAQGLTAKADFSTVYPAFLTADEFSARLVANMLGSEVSAGASTWATNWVKTQLASGKGPAFVISTAVQAVRATTNADFANAKAMLANKTEVASYYSVTKNLSDPDLADLQAIISGVTSAASTVTTAKATVDAEGIKAVSQTLTLSDSIDNVAGGAGNDIIVAGTESGNVTLNAGDQIDGGAGTDTLRMYDGDESLAIVTLKNVEIVEDYDGANSIDVSAMSSVTEVWQGKAAAVTLTAAKTQTVGFSGTAGGVAATATFTSATGTADAATIAVTDAGKTTAYTSITVAGIENLTVKATGTDKLGNLIAAAAETITVTGSGAVTATLLPGTTVLKSVDASANTGGVTLTMTDAQFGANEIKVTGGAGNDSIKFTDALGAKATVALGEGKNTLTITQGATALTTGSTFKAGSGADTLVLDSTTTAINSTSGAMFTGFETVQLSGAASSSYKVGDIAGITGYTISGTAAVAHTITNLGDAATVKISGTSTGIQTLTLADNSDATSSVKVSLNNAATTTAAAGIQAVVETNAHVLNITSDGLVNATTNKVDLTGTTNSLAQITNIKISGSQDLTVVTAAATALTLIDGSAATGKLTITATSSTKSMTVKGGSADDTITATDAANALSTVTGGKGADSITLGATAANNKGDIINVATVGDSTTSAYDSVTNFTVAASANNDVLKLGSTSILSGTVMGTGWSITDGLATKGGATLADFIAAFSTNTTAGVISFDDGTDFYVGYSDGQAAATNDVLVKLVGLTGTDGVVTTATNSYVTIA